MVGSDEFSFWVLTNLAGQPKNPRATYRLPLPEIAGVPYERRAYGKPMWFPLRRPAMK